MDQSEVNTWPNAVLLRLVFVLSRIVPLYTGNVWKDERTVQLAY